MDDRATDSTTHRATDFRADAGPQDSVMNNTALAARVRRARLASYLTAAVLILGGGFAITAGATGWLGSAGPSAAIPVPPRANAQYPGRHRPRTCAHDERQGCHDGSGRGHHRIGNHRNQ
jgi:hypothetical protein